MSRMGAVILSVLLGIGWVLPAFAAGAEETKMADNEQGTVRVRSFQPGEPICRASREATLVAVIENTGAERVSLQPRLLLPAGVKLLGKEDPAVLAFAGGETRTLRWRIEAATEGPAVVTLQLRAGAQVAASADLTIPFLPAVPQRKLPYIPEPQPVQTPLLIGAHHCPLWEADKPSMWANILKHPERTPALGFYAQENPEVSDWETKWAVEHGVSFFVYCWYRASQGEPVKTRFSSAIHDALFKSKFANKMKFTIMWENQSRGKAGIADMRDLEENLLPFWIENYFKHPSYLKIDNKPLLFIYRPEFLIKDLGSVEQAAAAIARMRQACRDAGFAGLYVLGEYRGLDPKHFALMQQLGLDYTFAYCWPIQNSPAPEQAVQAQMEYLRKTQELSKLPQVATVSQAWSGWADEGSIWKIPPHEFEGLLRQAKDFVTALPQESLSSKLLLLDNWNEWGEGHYIAPYREYGFGYLDAVRKVFAPNAEPHTDLIPADIGMGPYDKAYWERTRRDEAMRRLAAKAVRKAGGDAPGLLGWWSFDEDAATPVAFDYTGNRLGGALRDAERAPGIEGQALVCQGGCVLVPNSPLLSTATEVTLSCWVKSEKTGQHNNWFINRVLAGGIDTGFRLGVVEDKPCFNVPQSGWSHHLSGQDPLPIGQWVHLAGVCDGKTLRLYVNGEEQAMMERVGPVKPNAFPLCLGSYEPRHDAHFTGLLDEVKIDGRALSAEEVRAEYRRLAGKR